MRVEKNHTGEPLNSDASLAKFLEVEAARGFAEDGLFYRLYSVENYSETESVMMFSCHHAVSDGMSLIGLIASMQETYNKDQMYDFRPRMSFCMEILKFICMPICLLTALAFVGAMPQQENALTLKDG